MVTGTVEAIADYGSIVLLTIVSPQGILTHPIDHRAYQTIVEAEGGWILDRSIEIDENNTLYFTDD